MSEAGKDTGAAAVITDIHANLTAPPPATHW
jgi:hypothetical protein